MVPLCPLIFIVNCGLGVWSFSKIFVLGDKLLRCLISCSLNGLKNIISLSWLLFFFALSRQVPHSSLRVIHQAWTQQFIPSRATVTLRLLWQLRSYWLDSYYLTSGSVPCSVSKDGGCWIKLYFCRNQQPTQQLVPSIPGVGTGLPGQHPAGLQQPPAVPIALAELLSQWLLFWSTSISRFFYSKVVSAPSQGERCNHIHY